MLRIHPASEFATLAFFAALVLGLASTAGAELIEVTTTRDGFADDGRCSLREAVTSANTGAVGGSTPGECRPGNPQFEDQILLSEGVYRLDVGAAGEDSNLGGDLDVTQDLVITGAGPRKTIIENGIGESEIAGDGDRLFHVDPISAGDIDVEFRSLSLEGGDVGCEGAACAPGASAVEAGGDGSLVFEDSAVRKNRSHCVGEGCGQIGGTAAIRDTGGGFLTLRAVLVEKNLASCDSPGCRSGAAAIVTSAPDPASHRNVRIASSRIRKNRTTCSTEGCVAGEIFRLAARIFDVRATSISKNETSCLANLCRVDPVIDSNMDLGTFLDGVTLRRNTTLCEGFDCDTDELFDLSMGSEDSTTLEIVDTKISRNLVSCSGESCDTDELFEGGGSDGLVTIQNSAFRKNEIFCRGNDCDTDDIFEIQSFDSGKVVVEGLDVSRNRVLCEGLDCDVDNAFEILCGDSLSVDSTRFLKNRVRCVGTDCDTDEAIDLICSASADVRETEFIGNRSSCEGDLCDSDAANGISSDDATISESLFLGNQSRCQGRDCTIEDGGALTNRSDRLRIVDSDFFENHSDDFGGALYNESFGSVALERVVMKDNSAGLAGGAIFNAFSPARNETPARLGTVVISGSRIRRNDAGESGGGIHNEGLLELLDTRLEDNTPDDCVDSELGEGCL